MAKSNFSYKVSPARLVVFEILRRVSLEDAFATNLLTSTLTQNLSSLDRSLAQEIVLGILRHQRYIDFLLAKISSCNLAKLDLEVLLSLRIGFYQLLYLTRIPTHAIVNDSVNLVKLNKKASASGLVNAVLRKIANSVNLKKLPKIENPTSLDTYQQIALVNSHPDWLVKRWIERYGVDWTKSLAEANNKTPLVYFRVNSLKTSKSSLLDKFTEVGLKADNSSLLKDAFLLISDSNHKLLDFASQGLIHIQDLASQLVVQLVEAKAGMKVFDVCAAPGGKTTAIAAQMGNQGLIIAGDLHLNRVKLIKETANRLGAKIILPICYDARANLPIDSKCLFDRVLIDAPCSGTGTLRHNPEIKLRLSQDKILELGRLQTTILNNCSSLVKIGGRLIYSTCSMEYEENEEVIKKFLLKNSDFQIIKPKTQEIFLTQENFVRTWPSKDNMDGFFVAVLEKIK
ncbi:MAG: 16S rRNA (cytosine(967)-C(5))-methyltransferase RsmB [Acidobacteria bacterium]|nr:16S rRNA (cytosine(967)-C(5))-methyltransferase RsmB [Acidobacteriota bacterium]